ncbi:MAG: isoaspartyl peptidase/L-asparaginase family protein, partial [Bacteroidales bacterium]
MKNSCIFLLIPLFLVALSCSNSVPEKAKEIEYALVIHGGAGYMTPERLSEEKQEEYLKILSKVTQLGLNILENGGSSTDAVEAVIRIMEDSPLFNAGRGAVFTHHGTNELDASIMNGVDLNAGAVAGVKTIKHPISAARKVMEKSEHVLLAGEGAEDFAAGEGVEIVDPSYFFTMERFNELINVLEREGINTDSLKKEKLGTVGCVALDKSGNICAGTSTGGRTNKKYGRIGDSPLIG